MSAEDTPACENFPPLSIINVAVEIDLEVPVAVNGVDAKLLNPIETWDDKEEYKKYLQELVKKFQDNFEKFKVNSEIVSAGPRL